MNTRDNIAKRAAEIALSFKDSGIGFDAKFDASTDGAMYCTELVWRAYNEAGIDLSDGNLVHRTLLFGRSPYVFPSTLRQSSLLVLVQETPSRSR